MAIGAELAPRYEAAIDELEQAIRGCPDEMREASLWNVERTDPWIWPADGKGDGTHTDESIQVFSAFWYVAYHCIFDLDFYLSGGPPEFSTPEPFGGPEEHGADERGAQLPYPVYTRAELLGYLAHGQAKAARTLATLTNEQVEAPCPPGSPYAGRPFGDLLEINLAHLQEHGRQLAGFLLSGRG
jgi:hypothetical protein